MSNAKATAGSSASCLWGRWSNYLLTPVNGSGLGIFRILFGILMAWALYDDSTVLKPMFIQPAFLFSWFPFIKPWPEELLHVHYYIAILSAVLVSAGLFYRVSSAVLGISLTYFFFLDKANFVNHYYLIALLSAVMALLPADQCLSLDRYFSPKKYSGLIPRWTQEILKLEIVIIYLFAASWKLNPDWLAGVTCHELMASKGSRPLIGPYVTQDWFAHVMAFAGIFVDYSVPILLMIPRTVWLATLISLCFHLTNSFLFNRLDYFPYLMLGSLSLFYPYDWPNRVWAKLNKAKSDKEKQAVELLGATSAVTATQMAYSPIGRASALIFFHAFLLIQALLPFRCLTYPGNPDWTEQGYYFCWRLMVNNKKVTPVKFHIRDASTGETLAVVTGQSMLNSNQLFRMEHHPELSHKFALWLAERVEKKTGKRPIINAVQRGSLHGRPWQFMIDPTVDLAAQPDHWGPKSWIVPLQPHRAAMNVRVNSKIMRKHNRAEDHGRLAEMHGAKWWL